MSIFSEVKEYLTARQAAESYGLQVRKNGLACCPFHDDRHPSMKVDRNYRCFACGAGGDVIDYVSRMFGLSQYEAALEPNSAVWYPLSGGAYDAVPNIFIWYHHPYRMTAYFGGASSLLGSSCATDYAACRAASASQSPRRAPYF